ncbi:hypothetical protein [Chondromyces crocatus]|uniref:Outer membrane protein beta-barrel domain-containing protein n=1 Tax=Chondromyces crocatus TaxID=52 RepID=A0A0K1EJB0_CHOCO|nr:hypothetical protein [Chondromyces crocatus]AKT40956.1 uncharacterized protein CMC5_051130 [Chondromyces crocatus]
MRGQIALAVGGLVPLVSLTCSAWAQSPAPQTLTRESELRAESGNSPGSAQGDEAAMGQVDATRAAAYRPLSREPGLAGRVLGTIALGQGLRLNNPYRLQTQLGATGESLSLTAPYLDFGVAAMLGPADGLQHGASLRFSIGLMGVAQQSFSPTYMIAYRGPGRVLAYGRLGASLLITPDTNLGGELGVGAGYFLTSRIALMGELIGNLFYGAATWEKQYTVYPVVSAQLGLMIDYEILP